MPIQNNPYVFCADYSAMANCLFLIQNQAGTGVYASDPQLIDLLYNFENNLLKRLYSRTLKVFGTIEGIIGIPEVAEGDFEVHDFSGSDFKVNYLDTRNNGFSSRFQTILNIFKEFCMRSDEISQTDKAGLAAAFFPVLDAFRQLQQYLSNRGLNPCQSQGELVFNNSPELHLFSAGSDGTNGLPTGILLRWMLNGELGENHLPQGNYANGMQPITGYNRENDYVYLKKTPYTAPFEFSFDLSLLVPAIDNQQGKWSYISNVYRDGKLFTNIIHLFFRDKLNYNACLNQFDPQSDHIQFLQRYRGLLDVEVAGKNIFSFGIGLASTVGNVSAVKLEAFSLPLDGTGAEVVCLRGTANSNTPDISRFHGENIKRVSIQQSDTGQLLSFSFETYDDFFNSREDDAWVAVGTGYGLSLDDQQVFAQLENPAAAAIDGHWPQYSNNITVNTGSYHQKWSVSTIHEPSMKAAVQEYLVLSQHDSRASMVIKDAALGDTDTGTTISYLDVLNLMALDYHIARMLGLGTIDYEADVVAGQRFIYKIEYSNRVSLSNSVIKTYRYLSQPTGCADHRLPEKPKIRPVTYNLTGDSDAFLNAFDENGYDKRRGVRLVNIGREPIEEEIGSEDFFADNTSVLFNLADHLRSVLYGIEYRPESMQNYVQPGITYSSAHDTTYYAHRAGYPDNTFPEVVPVPDNEQSLYVHFVSVSGRSYYAIYGIDLFSRASELSEEAATDNTVFQQENQLKPPTDINVQYIQQEDTLIFTTTREQLWLQGRRNTFQNGDVSYTRLGFNWVDITDVTSLTSFSSAELSKVLKPDKVQLFYKPGQPLQLTGTVMSISGTGENNELRLLTAARAYLDNSLDSSFYSDEQLARFVDSLLITTEGQFSVVAAVNSPQGVVITINMILNTEKIEDPDDQTLVGTRRFYTGPAKGSRFTVTENLSSETNWDLINAEITLIDHSNAAAPLIEVLTDSEGNETKLWVGGITGDAIVTPVNMGSAEPPTPGYFQITFEPGVSLLPHPQINLPFDPLFPAANSPEQLQAPHVEWYKGIIRMPVQGTGDRRPLEVVRIESLSPLVLYAFDAAYTSANNQGVAPVQVSSQSNPVITNLNFHPGYRAYVFAEPAPSLFNKDSILPSGNINDNKSLIAARSVLSKEAGVPLVSRLTLPAVLLAFNVFEPVQPEAPVPLSFKVRPDSTNNAALTFDLKIGPDSAGNKRAPFGWMFYRTTNEDVLHSLYQPETVAVILDTLSSLEDDAFFSQRYLDLLNLNLDPENTGHFKVYGSYGFPLPDNTALDLTSGVLVAYTRAVHATLMPLTEQVPVMDFIKTGKRTENKIPQIQSIDGNMLDPTDPDFDPFPMVRKYETLNEANTTYIRVTDYTLTGNARFLYFYAAVEVSNRLVPGNLSSFAGPVTVLHTTPAEAPTIRSYDTGIRTAADGSNGISVSFRLSNYSAADPISKIRVFRSANPDAGLKPLSQMDSYQDFNIDRDDSSSLIVIDDFTNLTNVPLGETIYFRLAFVRTIINEFDQYEDIVSFGSKVIPVKLIDMFNPEAPVLEFDNIKTLTWNPTANKATYFLLQQNSKGNWQQVTTPIYNSDNSQMTYTLPEALAHTDEDGNPLFHRFKVRVQNASGLFNLTDQEKTI